MRRLDRSRRVPRAVVDPRHGLGLIARMFGNALARRIAYVVVAFALAGLGVGTARAQQSACNATTKVCPTRAAAYGAAQQNNGFVNQCMYGGQERVAERGNPVSGYVKERACRVSSGGALGSWDQPLTNDNPTWSFPTANGGCPAGTGWDDASKSCKLQCPGGFGEDPYNPGTCMDSQKCLAKNAGLSKDPVVRGFTSSCTLDQCQISMVSNQAQVSVDGFYTGVFEYTGNACSTPPVEPLSEDTAKEPPEQKCKPAGSGQTFCVKPNGEQCYSASTGRQICWDPTQAGEKTDRDVMQKRAPGPNEVPPTNLQLPSGDTLQKSGDSITKTTTITNNNSTTTITTTTTNYKTVNGTDAGATQQGEPSDGSGPEPGEGDGTSASGGEDCDSPPIVTGDQALNMVANQAWATRCAVEAGNAVKVTGDVGNCATPYTVEGNDANAEKLRAMRAQICGEAIADADSLDQTDGLDGINAADVIKEYVPGTGEGVGDLDGAGFGWGTACPDPPEFFGTTLDLVDFCNVMTAIGMLVAAMGALHAFYIIRGNS